MNQYNLYNLEASFKKFLISGNKNITLITLKNYLSDLRHFFGWLFFKLKSNSQYSQIVDTSNISALISKTFNTLLIEQYKVYLLENNVPLKSTNRRLSTIRKLCKFCLSQGWIKENPSKDITNVSLVKHHISKYYIHNISSEIITNEYKKALQSQKIKINNINNQINDVNEFFSVIS